MAKDNDPNVTRDSSGVIPGTGNLFGTIYSTTITDDKGKKSSGTGYSREEADQRAGEAYQDDDDDD